MLLKISVLSVLMSILVIVADAQSLKGKVTCTDGDLLPGANVHWAGTTIGTSTNKDGEFEISLVGVDNKILVVSFIGHESDTIEIKGTDFLIVKLRTSVSLTEVDIEGERPGTYVSKIDPIKTEVITTGELAKSACCDLAGCFNTEASVEPTTTNIITNSKELRILGLSGVYNQVLIDGMPMIKGLSYTYGISSYPGTLIENIYVSKGANSVLQGYEGIAGQINVIPRDPAKTDKLLLNVYGNSFGETQYNANFRWKGGDWSTLLALGSVQPGLRIDKDDDDFLDLPLITRYTVFNKWNYRDKNLKELHGMFALRFFREERTGGQMDFDPLTDEGTTNSYGQTMKMQQPEFYGKAQWRFENDDKIILFGSIFKNDQNSYFGETRYEASQLSAYSNIQYEKNWGDENILKAGGSYRYLDLQEEISFSQNLQNRTFDGKYVSEENIPGLFLENTMNWQGDKILLVTGLRADMHQTFGWKPAGRMLFKYQFAENSVVRASVGTGWRTANIFSENIGLLASSRDVVFTEELRPEEAVNYGVNLTHDLYFGNVTAALGLDFYRTHFSNQIFPDYDSDPLKAYISNYTGESVSNGLQGEVNLKFYKVLETKIAYNYLDVYRMTSGKKKRLPFNPLHKVNVTVSYKPENNKWHVDMNMHWYGEQSLPETSSNPVEYQLPDRSEPYMLLNAQVSKKLKRFDIYLGCENIFDFRQEHAIIGWENPFGPYFDTSSAWGPSRGREIYLGVRFVLDK